MLINASIVLKVGSLAWCTVFNPLCHLTLSWRRLLSYRNQSIDLLRKSVDWFLYDNSLRYERVNLQRRHNISKLIWCNVILWRVIHHRFTMKMCHRFIIQIKSIKLKSCRISSTLHKKCPNTELILVRIFLCSDWMQENTDQKYLRIWTLFAQCNNHSLSPSPR